MPCSELDTAAEYRQIGRMKAPHSFAISLTLAAATLGMWALYPRPVGAVDEVPSAEKAAPAPLRGLLLTGGCCHDYDNQKSILSAGLEERVNVAWEILHEGGEGTKHQFAKLKEEGWEKDYDIVLYNICFSHEEDAEYIESITKVHHAGLPAIALHCTAHTYHWKIDKKVWPAFLGMTSPRHGKHHPITVTNAKPDHPIMKDFPKEWVTPKGELYHIEKEWPTATVLAKGSIDGGETQHTCIWVNAYGEGRVFASTLGHHNETMAHEVYLDVLSRGLLWATGHLSDDGKPASGYAK